jgi:LmbE family N-acetylglucosaminyl deacetylase
VLPLDLTAPRDRPLSVLALGAHPDDIEIGAGGSLLTLGQRQSQLHVHYVVLTGCPERHLEARHAAAEFLPDADVTVELYEFPEGRLPVVWDWVKNTLEHVAKAGTPDLIIGPSRIDAHQDHRTIAEIVPTVFRNSLSIEYEIPKWDGDLDRPSVYVPMSADTLRRKIELLHKCFPSQRVRDWWDDEVFSGLARLRGVECRAPYAEAFHSTKSMLRF